MSGEALLAHRLGYGGQIAYHSILERIAIIMLFFLTLGHFDQEGIALLMENAR